MTEIKTSLSTFFDKGFLFKDINDNVHPFEFISVGKLRLKLIIFWYEKVLKYTVKVLGKDQLHQVLTKKNQNVIMSLQQRFKDRTFKIVKFQKFTNNIIKKENLTKYMLYILIEDEEDMLVGIKCDIL